MLCSFAIIEEYSAVVVFMHVYGGPTGVSSPTKDPKVSKLLKGVLFETRINH